MKRINKVVLVSLISLTSLIVSAQDTTKIISTDYFKANEKIHKVNMNMAYVSNTHIMEKACAEFLFNDSASITLKDAIKRFQNGIGKKVDGGNPIDGMHTFNIQLLDKEGIGPFTCYLLGKTEVIAERTGNNLSRKRTSDSWNIVYDNENRRLLGLEDLLKQEELEKVKGELGERRLQLILYPDHLLWGYQADGKLTTHDLSFTNDSRLFADSFKKKIGLDKFAAPTDQNDGDAKVYDVVEQMPSFPGGQSALFQWLSSNVKYPAKAEENDIQGRVIVTFVVERDGSITDVKVVKSVHPLLDEEAVRVTKSMPRWIAGKQQGKPIRVKYTIPLTFNLSGPAESKTSHKKNYDRRITEW
jgi:TonB family protein